VASRNAQAQRARWRQPGRTAGQDCDTGCVTHRRGGLNSRIDRTASPSASTAAPSWGKSLSCCSAGPPRVKHSALARAPVFAPYARRARAHTLLTPRGRLTDLGTIENRSRINPRPILCLPRPTASHWPHRPLSIAAAVPPTAEEPESKALAGKPAGHPSVHACICVCRIMLRNAAPALHGGLRPRPRRLNKTPTSTWIRSKHPRGSRKPTAEHTLNALTPSTEVSPN